MYTTYILSLSLLYHFITKVNCDTLQFQVKKTESIKLSHNGVFFSYKLSLFYYYYYYFTILYWFCHTSTCIHHGCTCVPHPEPLSYLPPHTIPLGHTSAPAPSFLYPASNLDWRFISYMILYMF